jgi:hypothetical protein
MNPRSKAREPVLKDFTVEAMLGRLLDAFESLLVRSQPPLAPQVS